jgi:hypothetical protein
VVRTPLWSPLDEPVYTYARPEAPMTTSAKPSPFTSPAPETASPSSSPASSPVSVALAMFRTLADKGINIQVISTSEIKISVLIDEQYLELALRALHTAYGLDAPA